MELLFLLGQNFIFNQNYTDLIDSFEKLPFTKILDIKQKQNPAEELLNQIQLLQFPVFTYFKP